MGISRFMRRGHQDSQTAADISASANPEIEKTEPKVALDNSGSDSDNLSLEARNNKEIQNHPNEVTVDAQPGVRKAEAAALVWSKPAVYATYAW